MADTLVIDLETKKSFAEVGGERNIRDLGISVAGIYSYLEDKFFAFEEHEIGEAERMLKNTEHVIGFNINHFDIPVFLPYLKEVTFETIAVTDMFADAVEFLGHRVGLNALAQATLKAAKSGNGLEALEWFKQGRIDDVKKYCIQDVKITRDLYEYGKKHGHVLFQSFVDQKQHSIPVRWGSHIKVPIRKVLETAFEKRARLAIEYVSSADEEGLGYKKERMIDIYKIKKDEVEAYCHFRKALRNFRINRILKAEPIAENYVMPQDIQHSLF